MKKLLIVGTILLTGTLLVSGTYFPDFPLLWMAGNSIVIELVRATMIVILSVLLFSNPPRSLYLRYSIGAISLLLCATTAALMLHYKISPVDAVLFLEIAVIFGIEALESPSAFAVSSTKQKKVQAS